jgi:rfaE bifunctional protein nucleotidyltransferase chain/domain
VLSWDEAARWRAACAGRVVFTNGVFDLLHPGHIDVLHAARRAGEHLLVAVNSDASVRRLGKGDERPIRGEVDRAYVLAALADVDAVVIFEQDTPYELIQRLQPDVLVKGGDYTPETIVGADLVSARGGQVLVVPLTPGQSTTSIVQRLRALDP